MPTGFLPPDMTHLAGFYQISLAMLVFALAGRAVLGGGGGPAVQAMVGWGAFCLTVTLWGMLTTTSLRLPAAAFALAAAAGALVRGRDSVRADLAEAGRFLALALPLLLVMAAVEPSQSDNLAVMMPNTAYIYDWGHFPHASGPPVYTDVPVAPYNSHLVSLLGSLAGGGYAPNSPSLFTVFLHLPAGLLLAGILARGERPGWRLAALGLGLATLLNPGFVPRVSFSGYGEAPLAIALLFAAWAALELMECLAEDRRPRWVPLVLALVVLVGIKQQGIGLFAAFLGGAGLAVLLDPRIGWRKGGRALALAALPAACFYLSWRGYVAVKFPLGELKALPFSQWEWHKLPVILADIGRVIARHPVYFGLIGLVALLLAKRPAGLGPTARRALVMTLGAIVFYNLFLLLTFVGHFRAEHSFFRYNTHQSLLLVLALALAARDLIPPRPVARSAAIMIPIIVAAPLAAAPLLRFDRDMPQPWLRDLATRLGGEIGPEDRVALVLPGDNASVGDALASLLRFAPERRPLLRLDAYALPPDQGLARAAAAGHTRALISCTDGNGLGLAEKAAAYLVREGEGWTAVKVWPWPQPPRRTWWNWTGFIANEPFCLQAGK